MLIERRLVKQSKGRYPFRPVVLPNSGHQGVAVAERHNVFRQRENDPRVLCFLQSSNHQDGATAAIGRPKTLTPGSAPMESGNCVFWVHIWVTLL